LIDQDAGLEQRDIEYLRSAVLDALTENAAGRYEPYLAVFPFLPCDTSCQSDVVRQSYGSYYVTGKVTSFAGSYVVTLWLLRPTGGPAANRAESPPLATAAALLEGTKSLVAELMAGGPFQPETPPAEPPLAPAQAPGALQPPSTHQEQPGAQTVWLKPVPEPSDEERSLLGLRIAAYSVLGVGGILTSVGGVLLIKGIESSMSDEEFNAAIALVIIGPSLAVAALIMGSVYRKRTKDDEPKRGLTAIVAPRLAALGYVARF
jgi:hypothetical protein